MPSEYSENYLLSQIRKCGLIPLEEFRDYILQFWKILTKKLSALSNNIFIAKIIKHYYQFIKSSAPFLNSNATGILGEQFYVLDYYPWSLPPNASGAPPMHKQPKMPPYFFKYPLEVPFPVNHWKV